MDTRLDELDIILLQMLKRNLKLKAKRKQEYLQFSLKEIRQHCITPEEFTEKYQKSAALARQIRVKYMHKCEILKEMITQQRVDFRGSPKFINQIVLFLKEKNFECIKKYLPSTSVDAYMLTKENKEIHLENEELYDIFYPLAKKNCDISYQLAKNDIKKSYIVKDLPIPSYRFAYFFHKSNFLRIDLQEPTSAISIPLAKRLKAPFLSGICLTSPDSLFVCGGLGQKNRPTTYLLKHITDSDFIHVPRTTLSTPLYNQGIIHIQDKIYLFGGYNMGHLSEAYVFSLKNNQWTQLENLPEGSTGITCLAIDCDKILIVGLMLTCIYQYSISTNTYQTISKLPRSTKKILFRINNSISILVSNDRDERQQDIYYHLYKSSLDNIFNWDRTEIEDCPFSMREGVLLPPQNYNEKAWLIIRLGSNIQLVYFTESDGFFVTNIRT